MNMLVKKQTGNISDTFTPFLFEAIAALTVFILVSIFLFLFVIGIGTFKSIGFSEFFLNADWNPTSYHSPSWGILSIIVGTLMVSFLSLLISVPFGIAIAIYLSEIASLKIRELLKPTIEMIAGIPSVVLGLIGLLFLAPFIAKLFHLSSGLNALTSSLLIAVASLPTIASICEDALSSVSKQYRETSLALGATKWITIKRVVVPSAKSGILAAIMLGLGRIIGETMIVLMVAGNSRAFPHSFLDPVRPMTASIAIDIKEVVVGSLHWQSLFAIGFLLFLLTFVINLLVDLIIHS